MQSLVRQLLKLLVPVTEWIGKRHLPFTVKRITGPDYYEIKNIILPGDVLCSKVLGAVSNLLIPGEFKHAAIYVGNDFVVEATGSGVKFTDLVSFCMSKDFIVLKRSMFSTAKDGEIASEWAKTLVGKPYDYLLDFSLGDNKAFYCSEVIWWSYEKTMGDSPFTPRESLGIQTVTPNDIVAANGKWQTIWQK